MYAVCVTFQLHNGSMSVFMPLMLANAQTSLKNETGCLQFDVLSNENAADRVFLYELYSDRAAFDAHLASDHFKTFDTAVAPMIAQKDIHTWDQVAQ